LPGLLFRRKLAPNRIGFLGNVNSFTFLTKSACVAATIFAFGKFLIFLSSFSSSSSNLK
jgi:hypothetical protein